MLTKGLQIQHQDHVLSITGYDQYNNETSTSVLYTKWKLGK